MSDKLLILSNPRMGSTFIYNAMRELDPHTRIGATEHMMTNEPFDKNPPGEVLTYTAAHANIVSKLHGRHLRELADSGDIVGEYIGLFNRVVVMLRRDLFQSSLSLAVSMKKRQWGVLRPMDDSPVVIDLPTFTNYIHSQWADIGYLLGLKDEYPVDLTLWIEDYADKEALWAVFSNRGKKVGDAPTTTFKKTTHDHAAFISHRSPDKTTTVVNYQECLEHFTRVTSLPGVSLRRGMVYVDSSPEELA